MKVFESGKYCIGKGERVITVAGASEWTRTTDPHHVKVVL
jgi:hypothetical protein